MSKIVFNFRHRKPKWKWVADSSLTISTGIQQSEDLYIEFNGTVLAHLFPHGELNLYKGYAWNGATGAIDTPSTRVASAAHDALYQWMKEGLLSLSYRDEADRLYYRLARQGGMFKFRANYHLRVLQAVGDINAQPKPEKTYVV